MVSYQGKYELFDASRIKTYPIRERPNRVTLTDLVTPEAVLDGPEPTLDATLADKVSAVADAMVAARAANKPVIFFMGAHPVKNGLGLLIRDLIRRDLVTLVATNCAGAIHDFELAMIGATSETVPNALPQGRFGMAYEFCYFNEAVRTGFAEGLGFGESLGAMICDDAFRGRVLAKVQRDDSPASFAHPEVSYLAEAYQRSVPLTVHATIGADVVDQHAGFDAAAKGGASGRDFLIYTNEVAKLTDGGVVLNVSCAVTGPEVLLKAISMAGNTGKPAKGITTADFDLRPARPEAMTDESEVYYYYRDQKSIVTRVPDAVGGTGYYLQGDHRDTLPALFRALVRVTGG